MDEVHLKGEDIKFEVSRKKRNIDVKKGNIDIKKINVINVTR